MARPPKPAEALKQDNSVSHRTKREIATRDQAEKSLLTGSPMAETREVERDKVAHQEFLRILALMESIGKNDELYGAPARRYCLNISRLAKTEKTIKQLRRTANKCPDVESTLKVQNMILRQEQFAAQIRNELVKFENDNGMTVAASLRIIPKKPEEVKNPLLEALNG